LWTIVPTNHKELKLAAPIADRELLLPARKDAFALVTQDTTLGRPERAALRRAVSERYGSAPELATVG
jgi:hypothetical protein